MAKFLKRMLKRHYKGKDHLYTRYVLEVPSKFNGKIASRLDQNFEVEITSSESSTQEVLNIALVTKKHPKNLRAN